MLREWRFIWPYLAVGFIGFCLNMTLLTLGLWAGVPVRPALLLGIAASTCCNFMLDRHWVFSHARERAVAPQFIGFLCVCLLGAGLNYATAATLLKHIPWLLPQVAEWAGILVGTSFNYLLLRFFIFKRDR